MHEAVLRQIVRQRVVPSQLAQEIPHMRLVSPDQLAKGGGILAGYRSGDEITIFTGTQRSMSVLFAVRELMQNQISHADRKWKSGNTCKNSRYIFFVRNTEAESN